MSFILFPCPHCRALVHRTSPPEHEICCPACAHLFPLPEEVSTNPVWYCVRNQEKRGPYSLVQLQQLAAGGQVQPTDMIWHPQARQGIGACDISGLWPAGRKPLASPKPGNEQELDAQVEAVSGPQDLLADADRVAPPSREGIKVDPHQNLTLGDFQIQKKLGAGGMGAVYLAQQRSQGRQVALKVLRRHLALQPHYVQRFYREATILASLDNPNIVRFYGVGEEEGFHYLAMEYVDGFSTARLLEALGGRLGIGDALHIILRCAAALRYAHECNVVHRDIKPQNIMITHLGEVKITDLGLAKPTDEDLGLTDTGTSVGTPRYMAPEQARNAKHADQRSDIYALGAVLYYFLTGQAPFQGESKMELLMAKEQGFFRSARQLNWEIPPRLDLVIDKMLAKDLRYRYQNCADLVHDLENLGLAPERLSMNPLRIERCLSQAPASPADTNRVQILLIHDDPNDILLAQEALDESGISSNLNVVGNSQEALAYLRREGKYSTAVRPHLIILGSDLRAPDSLEVLTAIKNMETRGAIPLVVLSSAPGCSDILQAHGLRVSLNVTKPEDLEEFDRLMKSVQGLCLTVVEKQPARQKWPR